jgi:hypothetical protein
MIYYYPQFRQFVHKLEKCSLSYEKIVSCYKVGLYPASNIKEFMTNKLLRHPLNIRYNGKYIEETQ